MISDKTGRVIDPVYPNAKIKLFLIDPGRYPYLCWKSDFIILRSHWHSI